MREYTGLYRGKRKDTLEWTEGNLMCFHGGQVFIVDNCFGDHCDKDGNFISVTSPFVNEVIPETVGECTGLCDKNGQLVFEGDIVHYLYEPGEGFWNCDQYAIVEWASTGFYISCIAGTNKYASASGWLVSIPHGDGKCFEIIGNVHDNPELLKGENT